MTKQYPALELTALTEEIVAVEKAWRTLLYGLSPVQVNWRPEAGRWSVGEHLAHLNLVDASYLPYLDRMLAQGRAAELEERSVVRHPWLGWWLVCSAEPPVRLKVRTTASYAPPSEVDKDAQLAEFGEMRRALQRRITAAVGLEQGRMRARYTPGIGPARFIVLSFGQWLALTAAHDRRHLWLAERVVEEPNFPQVSRVKAARKRTVSRANSPTKFKRVAIEVVL